MNCNCPRSSYGIKHTTECYDALAAELAEERGPTRLRNVALVDSLKDRIRDLEAIVAKDDTTESFRCSECGAWHVRKPTAPGTSAEASTDKVLWYCSECGMTDYPCNHVKAQSSEVGAVQKK